MADRPPPPEVKPLSDHMSAEMPQFRGNYDDSALPEAERRLLRDYRARVDRETTMETCSRYQRRWFGLGLTGGICANCRSVDKHPKRAPDEPYLFSAENNMHFGDVPPHLPKLTQIEEQLIARIHIFIDVRLIRGQQYRYSKHCVSFLRETGQLFDQLPRLPGELQLVALRPKSAAGDAHAIRSFHQQLRINRNHVEQWLKFLVANHPGYADLQISSDRLDQLPPDASQFVTIHEIDDADPQALAEVTCDEGPAGGGDDEYESDGPPEFEEVTAAPNTFAAEVGDISRLRAQLDGVSDELSALPPVEPVVEQGAEPRRLAPPSSAGPRDFLNVPDAQHRPINDRSMRVAIMSLAMPTLFPRGLGEFTTPRQRTVTWKQWVAHAMLWKDGRFASHSRSPMSPSIPLFAAR